MPITAAAQAAIQKLGLDEETVLARIPQDRLLALTDVCPIGATTDHPEYTNPKKCTDERLLSIANSLRELGWLPSDLPMVWEDPAAPTPYRLINGEHRWIVCRFAGFTRFPAVVNERVTTFDDAMIVTLALEEARALQDRGKNSANLIRLAASGKAEQLKAILRIQNPERLKELAASLGERTREAAGQARAATADKPRLVTLTFTGVLHTRYVAALGKAHKALRQAAETCNMLEELEAFGAEHPEDLVALAAQVRESHGSPRTRKSPKPAPAP